MPLLAFANEGVCTCPCSTCTRRDGKQARRGAETLCSLPKSSANQERRRMSLMMRWRSLSIKRRAPGGLLFPLDVNLNWLRIRVGLLSIKISTHILMRTAIPREHDSASDDWCCAGVFC